MHKDGLCLRAKIESDVLEHSYPKAICNDTCGTKLRISSGVEVQSGLASHSYTISWLKV